MTTDLTQITSRDLMASLDEYIQMANKIGLEKVKLEQAVGDATIDLKALSAQLVVDYELAGFKYNMALRKMECDPKYVEEAKKLVALKTRLSELESRHEVMTKAITAINGISWARNSEMKLQRG